MPQTQPLDLSAGMEPIQASPTATSTKSASAGQLDLSAGMEPIAGATTTAAPGMLQHVGDVASGFVKGLGETVEPISRVINKIPIVGETLAPSAGVSAMPEWEKSANAYQTAGKVLESGAEMAATEGMLSDVTVLRELRAADKLVGSARAARYVELADKYPTLAKAFNLATHHPWLAKMLVGSGEGAVVGGVEGAVKTRSVSGAAEGAAGGAVIGAASPVLLNPFKAARATGIPNYISDIWQGAGAAQEPAEAALRGGVQAGADVPVVQPQSLRVAVEQPIDALESAASKNYKLMDNATGGKFAPNVEELKNVNQELRGIAGTDPARESELSAAKTRLEWQRDQLLNEAEAAGVPKETVTTAKTQFRQAQALRDVEHKVFKNPSIIKGNAAMGTPETINVDSAIKALQKLQDSEPWGGPRLEQALGKDSAKALLKSLYDAQRQGVKAVSRQQLFAHVKTLAGYGAKGVAAYLGYDALKYIFGE